MPSTPLQDKKIEWTQHKRWNPFNSYKLLVHTDRWKTILRGRSIPSPVLVTIDPTNVCNFNCAWCNADFIRKHCNRSLSAKILQDIADFLPRWGEGTGTRYTGVKAICVAGGGEPLLNPHTGDFIDRVVSNGVEVGIVTNGSRIADHIDALSQCTWVGVSVDAGRPETFNALKGLKPEQQHFDKIMDNIATLNDYARRHKKQLGKPHPSYGISYKYLLYRENIAEIYDAAVLAKRLGCKSIHYRPAGTPWDKVGTDAEIRFTADDIALFNEQIIRTMELDDETFGVYGVTHKFDDQFSRCNEFEKCYAAFMTAVFMPSPGDNAPKDSFVLGLCCDRRGDSNLELLQACEDVTEINNAWGSTRHWAIHDKIDIEHDCPRCTYQPHNQIYEQVILDDSMTYKFI